MHQRLRRLTGWIATIALFALATGCSSPELTQNRTELSDRSSPEKAQNPSVTPSSKPTYGIGEVVSLTDNNLNVKFTVNGTREHPGKGVIKPNQDHKWVVVDTTIINKGQEPKTFSVVSFEVIDGENNHYEVALLAGALDDVESPTGEISPGEERQGEVAFEVPETAKDLKLLFKPNSSECQESTTAQKASGSLDCEPIVVNLDQ